MEKMDIWNSLNRPPKSALKTIKGGRLSGMTDISPQWRYQAMTEQFGPIGTGWKFEIVKLWSEQGSGDQIFAFATINLSYKMISDEWSEPTPGIGGSMLVATEKSGLHSSDEAYKMAVTDALSVAMKALGVAADIYAGLWDGSKYRDAPPEQKKDTKNQSQRSTPPPENRQSVSSSTTPATDPQMTALRKMGVKRGMVEKDIEAFLISLYGTADITKDQASTLIGNFDNQHAEYTKAQVSDGNGEAT